VGSEAEEGMKDVSGRASKVTSVGSPASTSLDRLPLTLFFYHRFDIKSNGEHSFAKRADRPGTLPGGSVL
jgi:hypothetical protein